MRNSLALNAAIAAVLAAPFGRNSTNFVEAEVVPREIEYASPVSNGPSYSKGRPHFDPLERRKNENRKRKKMANASRKRNRK